MQIFRSWDCYTQKDRFSTEDIHIKLCNNSLEHTQSSRIKIMLTQLLLQACTFGSNGVLWSSTSCLHLTSAWMLLYHADGLSSREQTIPLLIIYTFRVGDHQICEDPGLSSKFPNRNSYVEFPILRAFCHFSPTSSLLCVEIAARQRDIGSPLYIFHNCFTFQFFNDMCLFFFFLTCVF